MEGVASHIRPWCKRVRAVAVQLFQTLKKAANDVCTSNIYVPRDNCYHVCE